MTITEQRPITMHEVVLDALDGGNVITTESLCRLLRIDPDSHNRTRQIHTRAHHIGLNLASLKGNYWTLGYPVFLHDK